MQHLFSFIFYIKRSKADKNGKANIYLRITVNGKRAELSISRKVDVKKWVSNNMPQSSVSKRMSILKGITG